MWATAVLADRTDTKYSLQALIERAYENDAELAGSEWRVKGAVARQRQARAGSLLPRLRLNSIAGLVPDAKGDIFNPPSDTTGIRGLGPFNQSELEFVQPLYTFGQLSSLRRAAKAGVDVERAALADKRLQVAFDVGQLYYGILLFRDLSDLVQRLTGELEDKQDEIERKQDEIVLPLSGPFKLRLALLDLEKQRAQVAERSRLTIAALALKTGLPEDSPIELAEERLLPLATVVPALEHLQNLAQQRPDWRMLNSGILARKALRDAAKSAYYPQIFLAGGLRYAVAPNRTDQHNPFVKDEFNLFSGGVFLGLRQSFEWDMLGAGLDKARAELFELKSIEAMAARGIRLDVGRAYGKYEEAAIGMASAEEARHLSRQWLRLARDEYEFDPGQIKELISAFESFAKTEQEYHQSIFDYNVSLARLERVVGGPLVAVKEEE
ncbi:MAG: TolC family protein [Candidatus Latescibacterota bacterium]|nr:TolC family protein [Candidatus Latescibacterota bacterium]